MQHRRTFLVAAGLLALPGVFSVTNALAATPSFTFAATNVTMPNNTSSGVGSSSFTLTSVNGFAGTVGINCSAPTPPAGVTVPVCDLGALAYQPYTLAANQVVTGSVTFYNSRPPCNPCPVSLPRREGHWPASGLALAGALLMGFGFRRRTARWLTLTLLAAGTLAGLAGISACGGNKSAVTPGTYAYTITAAELDTSASPSVTISVNVTVP
jgi:hypothetical protein